MIVFIFIFILKSVAESIIFKCDNKIKKFTLCFADSIILICLYCLETIFEINLYMVFISVLLIVIKAIIVCIYFDKIFKAKNKVIIALILSVLFLFLYIPYLKVEVNTLIYHDEFQNSYKLTNMFDNPKFFKVFYVKSGRAKILYGNDHEEIVVFMKEKNNKWTYDCWDSVWSDMGSASEYTYPFYGKYLLRF